MEPQPISIRSMGLKYGIIAAVAFIIVFLIARAIPINNPAFRFVNYLILAICIGLALNEERRHIHKHRLSYLPGLGIGVWTAVTTALIYALFILLYANVFDKGFIEDVRPHLPFQDYMSAGMMAFVAFGETMVFGAIASFVLMQLFKRNRAPEAELAEEQAEKNTPSGRNSNVQ
ncbi:MAG: DUF4199 domain-containing protein [Sphingobacteriales bacterium]|nr:MAG: DUF4199 domain-containing protein [Sphingobacteriales bacterium]